MKRFVYFFSAVTFLLAASFSMKAQQNPNESYIEVHGSAEKEITPDIISISITISESDYRNRSLQTLEKEMKSSLKAIGINLEKDLKVADMSSSLQKRFVKKPDAVLSRDYTLEVHDAATAGAAMAALEKIGISNCYVSKAEYSAIDSLKIEIKKEAVRNAKAIALAMTEAIDQKLGPAFYIYEQENRTDSYQPRILMTKMASNDMVEEESLPELQFDDMKVTCRVTVRFRL